MDKSREDILAERKLRKAEKLAKKKSKVSNGPIDNQKNVETTKETTSLVCKDEGDSKKSEIKSRSDVKVINLLISDAASEAKGNLKPNVIVMTKTEKEIVEIGKSKAELKAERRAKQESQRALKSTKKQITSEQRTPEIKPNVIPEQERKTKTETKVAKVTSGIHRIKLFSHLYRNMLDDNESRTHVHKAVVKLGVQYKEKIIIGSDARVVALLHVLKEVISDFETPAEKDFSRSLDMNITAVMKHLNSCRPISVSMENATRFLKTNLLQLSTKITDREAKIKLRKLIDVYIEEQIDMAGKAICISVQHKISDGDVILTYGYSSLIERILTKSRESNIRFSVVVVDAAPLHEGKELLRRLRRRGIECAFSSLTAVNYAMHTANMVLLGAHALLTNGYVMGRAGAAQVALVANAHNVPVLVCCATHKFSERVQTDALVINELGNPGDVLNSDLWLSNNHLTPLSLMYDVTPSDLVTAVVTELAILPCTSVPVVLRVKPVNSTV